MHRISHRRCFKLGVFVLFATLTPCDSLQLFSEFSAVWRSCCRESQNSHRFIQRVNRAVFGVWLDNMSISYNSTAHYRSFIQIIIRNSTKLVLTGTACFLMSRHISYFRRSCFRLILEEVVQKYIQLIEIQEPKILHLSDINISRAFLVAT